MGPKTEKDAFSKVAREKRGTGSREVSRERSERPRGAVWMKKVRNIRWHTVLIATLKTETRNFVLNPSLHWKPVECVEQCRLTCMPGLTEDKSSCVILYALKLSVCCQGYPQEENYSSLTYRE